MVIMVFIIYILYCYHIIPIIIFYYYLPLDKKIIESSFIFSNTSGFDLTPDKLTFGKVTLDNSVARDVKIENNFNYKIRISIKSSGEISKNLIVSENNFILNPNQSKNITFSVNPRGLIDYREYFGKVIILSKRY